MRCPCVCVCVLFAFSRSDVVYNPSDDAITDHSQSVKYRHPYFMSQLYAEDPNSKYILIANGTAHPSISKSCIKIRNRS